MSKILIFGKVAADNAGHVTVIATHVPIRFPFGGAAMDLNPQERAMGTKSEDYDPITIEDVTVKAATDKALLCVIGGDEHWLPLSQLLDGSEVEAVGEVGEIVIPTWLAREKGLL